MHDVHAEADYLQLVLHRDDQTPVDFVVDLVRSVFSKTTADAVEVVATAEDQGKAVCGTYPRDIAEALLRDVRQRVIAAGHPLSMTVEAGEDVGRRSCRMCRDFTGDNEFRVGGKTIVICDKCALGVVRNFGEITREKQFEYANEALEWHFAGVPRDQLVATSRQFPGHMRADVQAAVDNLFGAAAVRFFGIHERHRYETLTIAALTEFRRNADTIAPAQYQEIDIGEAEPVKCLDNGLWLCLAGDLHYAVLISAYREPGRETGIRIEIAVPAGADGAEFVRQRFSEIENIVNTAHAYRGKVLSFDADPDYRGSTRGLMVHKLPPIKREDVILPDETLRLLDRNVLSFVGHRARLRELGQSTRKGILLYGPPGTGKTHTIRYLASSLPDHTTLIITAEQIGGLGHYMSLARLLQPAMVVIEDVDLIGRSREMMGGACEESLLNRLLNEMDGLKEDADILFVLTTNRPEQLEAALASRPGRIDQAIEVPLPDDIGRDKLVRLYGKGLPLSDAIVNEAARRTQGVSAAFIKELMRRMAQASIVRDGGATLQSADLGDALNEMLFSSGKLNIRLLGGAQRMNAAMADG
jgi:ATP-dependent Clp protease adapter protein ClpS